MKRTRKKSPTSQVVQGWIDEFKSIVTHRSVVGTIKDLCGEIGSPANHSQLTVQRYLKNAAKSGQDQDLTLAWNERKRAAHKIASSRRHDRKKPERVVETKIISVTEDTRPIDESGPKEVPPEHEFIFPNTGVLMEKLLDKLDAQEEDLKLTEEFARVNQVLTEEKRGLEEEIKRLEAKVAAIKHQAVQEKRLADMVEEETTAAEEPEPEAPTGPGNLGGANIKDADIRRALVTYGWKFQRHTGDSHILFRHPEYGLLKVSHHLSEGKYKQDVMRSIKTGARHSRNAL